MFSNKIFNFTVTINKNFNFTISNKIFNFTITIFNFTITILQ